MVKKNNTPETAPTASELTIELPNAFKQHDPSLKGATLQLALQTGAKHPEIVQSVVEFRSAIATAGEKYYHILHALRAAKLPKKEATALLLGLGFNKARASELNRVSAIKDEVWQKYSEKSIGFKAALGYGEAESDESSDVGTTGDGTAEPSKRTKAKIHSLPKPVAKALHEAMLPWLDKDSTLPRPNKSDKRTEYGFTIEKDGRTLYFQIFADKAD